ncbi:MAG: MIP/aquaporin family protein [Candidatus Micrarchaeaceae archaeon]
MAKNPTLFQKAFVEGLGTFILVFIGAGAIISSGYFFSGSAQLLVIALALGLALGIAVTIALDISGGHINPAVTIAMFVTNRIKAYDAVVYIIAQLIGAVIGAGVLLIVPSSILSAGTFGMTTLNSSVSVFQGIAIEALITFVLMIVVFATTVDKRTIKMGGFAVGLALTLGILFAGPLTGGSANPARSFGPELITSNFTNWYVYWIGPIIGAVLAALLYQYILLKK